MATKKALDLAQCGTVFLADPTELTRVTDVAHCLYDPRVHDAPAEWLINRIERKGYDQTQVIIVRKNGDLLEIVDGRHKHAAVLEINRRRTAELGDQAVLIKVPVIRQKAKSDVEFAETMLITTYLRKADSVILAAEKLFDYMQKFGRSREEAAEVFGLSVATVKVYEKLMELSEPVKDAVRQERISAHDAVKTFSGMTREAQAKNMEAVLASSPAANRGKADPTNPTGKKKTSAASRLRSVFRDEAAMESLSARERAMLGWFFGKTTLPELMATHPALADAIEKIKAQKKASKAKAKRAESRKGEEQDEGQEGAQA